MIPIDQVILLSAALFTIGMVGALLRRNLIVILMSIELMLNAVNLAFIGFNRLWAVSAADGAMRLDGQIFVLMVITVAAAEVAVGLGIVIALVRNRDSVNIEEAGLLRW